MTNNYTNINKANYISSNIRSENYNNQTNAVRFVIKSVLNQVNTFLPCEITQDDGNH